MIRKKKNIRKACDDINALTDLIRLNVLQLVYEKKPEALARIGLCIRQLKKETHRIKRTTWRGEK